MHTSLDVFYTTECLKAQFNFIYAHSLYSVSFLFFLSLYLCVSRAGKTEVLTDDLQAADKHVEQIRAALMGLSKRLANKPSESNTLDLAHKEKRLVSIYVLI